MISDDQQSLSEAKPLVSSIQRAHSPQIWTLYETLKMLFFNEFAKLKVKDPALK